MFLPLKPFCSSILFLRNLICLYRNSQRLVKGANQKDSSSSSSLEVSDSYDSERDQEFRIAPADASTAAAALVAPPSPSSSSSTPDDSISDDISDSDASGTRGSAARKSARPPAAAASKPPASVVRADAANGRARPEPPAAASAKMKARPQKIVVDFSAGASPVIKRTPAPSAPERASLPAPTANPMLKPPAAAVCSFPSFLFVSFCFLFALAHRYICSSIENRNR